MDGATLKRSFMMLAKALLNCGAVNEKDLMQRLLSAPATMTLKQPETPKASLHTEKTMGGGTTYPLEMTIGGMTIGISLITNYDRMPDGLNRFLEIVPLYVARGNQVNWWAFESDGLVSTLLNNQVITLATVVADTVNTR